MSDFFFKTAQNYEYRNNQHPASAAEQSVGYAYKKRYGYGQRNSLLVGEFVRQFGRFTLGRYVLRRFCFYLFYLVIIFFQDSIALSINVCHSQSSPI